MKRMTTEEFVAKAKMVHGDKYDYSKTIYNGQRIKAIFVCPIHGEFLQYPEKHLITNGCWKCGNDISHQKQISTKEHFIERAKNTHGDKYDYSLVEYKNARTKVKIICPHHGIFEQTPESHQRYGCPMCKESRGEIEIRLYLKNKNINFISQYKIPNESIFCFNRAIFVDFWIREKNTIIEYNGRQHYEPVDCFGGKQQYIKQKERDMSLKIYCSEHKIKLIEIPYTRYKYINSILDREL